MEKRYLLGTASAVAMAVLAFGAPAYAGNIVLTGHDNDFHYSGFGSKTTGPGGALAAEIAFVRNGSTLPVLTFDAGSQLTSSLTALGISFTNVNPSSAINPAVFDATKYSAFAVASVTSCGGCDNTPGDIANIAADKTAIASFFNAGGGILGLTSAQDPNGYAYLPESSGTTTPIFSSSGFVQTALGKTLGFPAVNGDQTHNTFLNPGSPGGPSALYGVTERFGGTKTTDPAVTLALSGGKITCTGTHCKITKTGGSVPEPGTLSLFGAGLIGLAAIRRRRRKTGEAAVG